MQQRISVFGATGFAGSRIAAEAARRGHEVTGVSRTAVAGQPGMTTVSGSLYDQALVERLLADADAVVVAIRAGADDHALAAAVPGLLDAAERLRARVGFVGGASTLATSEGGPRLADTPGFPEAFRGEAAAQAAVLAALRSAAGLADWFYLSPAELFGAFAPGQRTGTYRSGDDVLLVDDTGKSSISGDDYAIAFVDELETPKHVRTRFTVGY